MAAKKSASPSKRKAATTKKGSSPKGRSASNKAKSTSKAKAGDQEVTLDRRRSDRRVSEAATDQPSSVPPMLELREKVQRRRQIDPTTCERDYSVEEVEFMSSMDEYKRKSGRMFPTCSEVLEVIRELGYVKLSSSELAALRPDQKSEPAEEVLQQTETDADRDFETVGAEEELF